MVNPQAALYSRRAAHIHDANRGGQLSPVSIGVASLRRWSTKLRFAFRHRSDYGTQESVYSFRRLEHGSNVRFEDNGNNILRHLLCKAIRLGTAVVEPI